ncbi:hypothetical protein TRVA0_003S04016 [Trichomonascus vanleenenianus]|uniref:CORVET complex subunit VPS3 n=1 Tax=Trichomonascus vanleenenianus TaxID=2268995 RepID=UPI003ECB9074
MAENGGVYARIPLVPADAIDSSDKVTCLAAWENSLYLGTSNGEILHYFRAGDSYIMASRQKSHPRKTRAVSKILLVPNASRAFVLTNMTTSVFTMPEFAPCSNMGSLRDVFDFSLDVDNLGRGADSAQVTVFSRSLIRIVTVRPESLKLVRNIDYPGVVAGVRRSSFALVASAESYDLIDLENIRKIPLFPVSQAVGEDAPKDGLTPNVVPVGHDEFLLTSGTKPGEPAMGLVVNVDGDISRGTLALPDYPSSVGVDFPYVAASIGNQVLIYTLLDQSIVQTIDFESPPLLTNVQAAYSTTHEELADKLRYVPLDITLLDVLQSQTVSKEGDDSDGKEKGEEGSNEAKKEGKEGGGEGSNEAKKDKAGEDITEAKDETAGEGSKGQEDQPGKDKEGKDGDDNANDVKQVAQRIEAERDEALKLSTMSSSMFVYTAESGVECILSAPRILDLEKMVLDNKIERVSDEVDTMDISNEESLRRFEYLKLIIGLGYLLHGDFANATPSWVEGSLDPRIIPYVYTNSMEFIKGDVWVFNGVHELIEKLAAAIKQSPKKFAQFYRYFLKEWLKKRSLESVTDKRNVLQTIELAYLHLLITAKKPDKEAICSLIDTEIKESAADAEHMLQSREKYFLLSRLYQAQGDTEKVLESWRKMLTGEWKDADFTKGHEKMAAYLLHCTNRKLVWDYGLWLSQVNPKQGMKVFTSESAAVTFDEKELIAEFKKFDDNDTCWREYLNFLVYDKKSELFKSDLISFLLDDYLDQIGSKKNSARSEIEESYKAYKKTPSPKRTFRQYINSRHLQRPSNKLLRLRRDVLDLLDSTEEYDADKFVVRLESSHPELLTAELCILYGRQGRHERVLTILCYTLEDYDSALEYCNSVDETNRKELFEGLYNKFLKIPSEEAQRTYIRKILERFGSYLDFMTIMEQTPSNWPVETLSGYLNGVFRRVINDKNQSIMNRALSRSQHTLVTKRLNRIHDLNDLK